jgi:hypothetical protein
MENQTARWARFSSGKFVCSTHYYLLNCGRCNNVLYIISPFTGITAIRPNFFFVQRGPFRRCRMRTSKDDSLE